MRKNPVGIDSFRIVILRRALRGLGGHTMRADMYRAVMDAVSTGLAMAGIVLASIGMHHMYFAAALVPGVLLLFISAKPVQITILEFIDTAPTRLVQSVREMAESVPEVGAATSVMLRKSGDTLMADTNAALRRDLSFGRAHSISDIIGHGVRGGVVDEHHGHGAWEHFKNARVMVHMAPEGMTCPAIPGTAGPGGGTRADIRLGVG